MTKGQHQQPVPLPLSGGVSSTDRCVLRTSIAMRAISGAIAVLIMLPGADALRRGQWSGLTFVAVGALVFLVPNLRYRVCWDERELVYRGLWTTRRIAWADVGRYEIHGPTAGDRFGPTLGLRIFSRITRTVSVDINIKPFDRAGLGSLAERLKNAEREPPPR